MQVLRLGQVWAQNLPDDHADIFRRRVQVAELHRIEIQVMVVEAVFHLLLDQVGQPAKIDDVAGSRVYLARYFHFQFIIVAVVIGVVAQAEYCTVALIRPGRIVQTVGGIEMRASDNSYFHGSGFK